jgi:hypothetical protein
MNDLDRLKETLVNLIEGCLEDPQGARELITLLSSPDTRSAAQRTAGVSKDPAKATLIWLRKRQHIIKYTEPNTPVMLNGAIEHIKPPISEWRIAKTEAYIYRELCSAAEAGEIPFIKDAISDFMINNLKQKNGDDITQDSLTKADKRRQNQTK